MVSVNLWFTSAPGHKWGLVEGRLRVSAKGWRCVHGAILLTWDSPRATGQDLSFFCSSRHPLSKHVPGLGCVSRTTLGTPWGGKEVKGMVLASNICGQHMITSRIMMADTTYLMCQPFLRSIFEQKRFLGSDQEAKLEPLQLLLSLSIRHFLMLLV